MRLKQRNTLSAVTHDRSFGLTFGRYDGIHVCNNANICSDSVSNVGSEYECPAGQTGHLFLTGGRYFQASEVEVFSVQKKEE
eukprot:10610083-Ditylum_brightwellii.AAC.1